MKPRYIFAFLIAVLILSSYLFYIIFLEAKQNAISELNSRQMIHARQAQRGIETFFKNTVDFLTKISQSDHVMYLDDQGRKELDFARHMKAPELQAITRLDAAGRIVYTTPFVKSVIGRDISHQEHVIKILNTRAPVVSDVFTAVQGYPAIALHVPVFHQEEFRGTLGVLIDFEAIAERFLDVIQIGETGYAWMTSQKGIELYCPVPGHIGRSVFENCKDFPTILSMAEEMLKGQEGITTYVFNRIRDKKPETVKKHAVYLPIKIVDSFWSIVIASSESEVLAGLVSFKNRLIIIAVLLFVCTGLFSYYGMKTWGILKEAERRKKAEESLRRIEWMLTKSREDTPSSEPGNRDLTRLNKSRLILDAVGDELLKDIVGDFLELLDTSAAVYEMNGDYAAGIFSSGWCRLLDQSSRDLCQTQDDEEALASGRWLCHESCWTVASKSAMESDKPVDIECSGGIRIYALPIQANGVIVGAINFGYGDPPTAPDKLRKISEIYDIPMEKLVRNADEYETRPPYIIELAKRRLAVSARLIGGIIELRQAEETLRHERDLTRHIMETSPAGITRVDVDGNVVYANKRAEEILGIRTSGGSSRTYNDPEWRITDLNGAPFPEERLPFHMVRQTSKPVFGVRHAIHWPNGKRVLLSINAAPLTDAEGKFDGMVSSIEDITEREKADEERKILEAQLLQSHKMEAIGTLAGGIAHDFNNILGIIVGNTDLAMFDIPEWSPAQESLKEIRRASLRARDLVTQILLFARKKEHAIAPIHIETIAEDSMRMLRSSIPAFINIRKSIAKNLPPVIADPSQIQQVIMNLCTNAAQVLEEDGGDLEFTLDAVRLEAPLTTATGRIPEGLYVRMRVRDTGPGIEPANQAHIFEPFFTTKGVGEGTGLGLAVVHGIVLDRNGGIALTSEPGIGTTFTVYLPASEHDEPEKAKQDKHEMPRGTERILFVDDEPSIARLGRRILENLGYTVETRLNATEALELFRADPSRFDLVITDMTMPRMTGEKLAREILTIRPGIPVILCTGYSRRISEETARELGVRGFIMKPLTAVDLAAVVRDVLDKAQTT